MLTKMNLSGGNCVSDGIRFNIANDRDLVDREDLVLIRVLAKSSLDYMTTNNQKVIFSLAHAVTTVQGVSSRHVKGFNGFASQNTQEKSKNIL
jgi:hypothetical protein